MKSSDLSSRKPHWLDHANSKYTETEVSDTKTALNVIAVFTTYPVFWSLLEQQVRFILHLLVQSYVQSMTLILTRPLDMCYNILLLFFQHYNSICVLRKNRTSYCIINSTVLCEIRHIFLRAADKKPKVNRFCAYTEAI